ncbi:hypothetical protein RJ55_08550 [Drechmeria coniospora]|nr:hypothetical protein RJ55_08550 [Drechmeria coniospora]
MEPPQDFKSLQEDVQKSLVSTIKTVNRLAAEDLSFQRTANPDVADDLDDKVSRLLQLSTSLIQSAAKACGVRPPAIEDVDDIDMKWQSVVDVVDSVLEKADTALDEYTGLVKRKEPSSAESAPNPKRTKSVSKVIRNANVTKPQAVFEVKSDNFPTGPWKPILTEKPCATIPLDESLVMVAGENGALQYKHPYETEISAMSYPDRVFHAAQPTPPQPDEKTSATWVDTYEGVLDMLKELKKAKEIAVDLEHHDFRTYNGLVCLMQISTREKDWIVDTLRPWRHKLEILNQVFADPSIVKVFHGAYMDMLWLQRDLGLYVNGLFDTFFACDLLAYPGKSLAFLLSKFVNFDADKQYQLADWRIRPIPQEMLYYARSDTHFLLYIYDHLRNELVAVSDRSNPETDYITRALDRSKELALSRHEHPEYDESTGQGARGWYNYLLKQAYLGFDGEQFAVFRALWKWRDELARQEDESPNFVLPSNNIISIVRVNPPDIKALHSMLPLTAPLARSRFNEIWDLVREAKSRAGPTALQFFTSAAAPSAETVKPIKLTQIPELGEEVVIPIMSRSQLFGDMPLSTMWEAEQAVETRVDNIPFPWQRFTQDAMTMKAGGQHVDVDPVVAAKVVKAPPLAAGNSAINEDDEEFTLKRGRKRKSEDVEETISESDTSSCSDTSSESESEEDEGLEATEDGNGSKNATSDPKQQRRREREAKKALVKDAQMAMHKEKQLKKRKKMEERQQQQQQQQQDEEDEEAPFDYSKASSVMHARKDVSRPAKVQKPFDPYAKIGDNPMKGARKAPPVKGERSSTFRK